VKGKLVGNEYGPAAVCRDEICSKPLSRRPQGVSRREGAESRKICKSEDLPVNMAIIFRKKSVIANWVSK